MIKRHLATTFALVVGLLCWTAEASAQQYGSVYLNDGSVLTGQIVDYGDSMTVTVDDGRVFTISRARIQRVEMSAAPPPQTTPEPQAGPTQPPPNPMQTQPPPDYQQQQQQQPYPQQQQYGDPMQGQGQGQGQPVVAPPQPASTVERRVRLDIFGTFGVGGNVTFSDIPGSASLDPTIGLGLRLEIPIGPYIMLGPWVRFTTSDNFTTDAVGFDPGIWIKGRYFLPNILRGLELYGGVPIGLAIVIDTDGVADPLFGVTVGVRAGAQLFVTERIGILLEGGVTRNTYFSNGENFSFLQGTINIGAALVF